MITREIERLLFVNEIQNIRKATNFLFHVSIDAPDSSKTVFPFPPAFDDVSLDESEPDDSWDAVGAEGALDVWPLLPLLLVLRLLRASSSLTLAPPALSTAVFNVVLGSSNDVVPGWFAVPLASIRLLMLELLTLALPLRECS